MSDTVSRPARIVIVGAGFAGAYCAQKLERRLRGKLGHDARITLIDPRNYFIFYPFLIEAGTGALEPRHAVVSIRAFLRRTEFLMAEAMHVDYAAQELVVRVRAPHGEEMQRVRFDHLILAPGSVTLHPPIPGLSEHSFAIKNLPDAVALRDRAIRLLEVASALPDEARRRSLLHWVIVGGSFTGAELAGEFHEFLRRVVRRYPNVRKEDCAVTLVEREDRILRALHPRLSRYAEDRMRRRGITIRLRESVREVSSDHVILAGGERLDSCTTVWCAGIAPPPLLAELGLPRDERGYILCERDCRVRGFDNVWAIGDCAVNIDAEGNAYPATAQHAVREGRHVADNIARVLAGRSTAPLDYHTQGSLAALGCRTGVAEVFGIRLSGFPAWWLWRTVYLFKIPGLARKVRIAIDWTLDLLFRRDDVQLGVHEESAQRNVSAR